MSVWADSLRRVRLARETTLKYGSTHAARCFASWAWGSSTFTFAATRHWHTPTIASTGRSCGHGSLSSQDSRRRNSSIHRRSVCVGRKVYSVSSICRIIQEVCFALETAVEGTRCFQLSSAVAAETGVLSKVLYPGVQQLSTGHQTVTGVRKCYIHHLCIGFVYCCIARYSWRKDWEVKWTNPNSNIGNGMNCTKMQNTLWTYIRSKNWNSYFLQLVRHIF